MEKKIKTLAIVQARSGSKRFPKKILKKIGNKSILEILLRRLKRSKEIKNVANSEGLKFFLLTIFYLFSIFGSLLIDNLLRIWKIKKIKIILH